MINWKNMLAFLILIALCSAIPGRAQTVNQVITSFGGGSRLLRPSQLALSPSGGAVAMSDQHGNHIYVFDTDGQPLWSVGDAISIAEPTAVCFDGEDAVLFSLRNKLLILRATKSSPATLDTVADLSTSLPKDATIDQILDAPSHMHLILDRHGSTVYRFKANWEKDKELISRGSRKGELWSPASLTTDLSGNILVADEGSYPLQTFAPTGRFLFFGGWNSAEPIHSWSASALAVAPDEKIWVADIAGNQWRVFDHTGGEIARYAFTPPVFHPNAVVATPDNRLIIAEERGSVIIVRLP